MEVLIGISLEFNNFVRRKKMKDKLLLVVLFFVLGSAIVSSIGSLSYTLKSIFYGAAMTALVVIGLVSFLKYLRDVRD